MMGSPVNPKVSVAMVTYNHAQFIRTAISSVLSQETNFPFELVVGDDCSTDGTTEIVRTLSAAHPDVIRFLHRERNIGASKNFQDVLDNCRGQYIAILDGDDYFKLNKIQSINNFFKTDIDYEKSTFTRRRTRENLPSS